MQEKQKIVLENLFSLGIMQFCTYMFPLITVPYITRMIGIEYYGLIAFANSFIQYFIIITDYGADGSGVYRTAKNRHNRKSISNIFNAVTASKIITFCIASALMIILIFSVPKLYEIRTLIFICYLSTAANILTIYWFFIGIEKMKYLAVFNFISGAVYTALIFIFVKNPQNYILVPLFTSSCLILTGIFSFYTASKKEQIKFYIPKWKSILYQFKFSTQFFISKIVSFGSGVTNIFCLGLLCSMVQVGYYNAAYTVYTACSSVIAGISQALYPYMIKNKDMNFYKRYSITAIAVCSLFFTAMFIFAKPLVTIYFGADMTEAYKVLQLFCIHLFLQIWSVMLADPLLGAYGHIDKVNMISIITSVIHYIGLFLLIITGQFTIYSIVYLIIAVCIISIIMKVYYLIKFKIVKAPAL